VAKEKVTKEKGHPAWRLPPIPGRQVREPGPGFSNGHPARAKRSRPPCRLPLCGLSSPSHRRTGAPGRAAGHRGLHFSEEPGQRPERRFASAFHRVRARKARCSTRGPSAAAGGWRNCPQGGRHGCRPVWRQGRRPCRQTP